MLLLTTDRIECEYRVRPYVTADGKVDYVLAPVPYWLAYANEVGVYDDNPVYIRTGPGDLDYDVTSWDRCL